MAPLGGGQGNSGYSVVRRFEISRAFFMKAPGLISSHRSPSRLTYPAAENLLATSAQFTTFHQASM
jgi:hypothetical protein